MEEELTKNLCYQSEASKVYKKGGRVLNLLKCSCFALVFTSFAMSSSVEVFAAENAAEVDYGINSDVDSDSKSLDIDGEVVSAPSYNKLIPLVGWNRYSGDTAFSVGEWKRWWQYISLKKPAVMKWMDGLCLRIYPKNEVFRSLFVKGIYDPNLIVVINALLPAKGVFLDIGSNMGYCSLLMSKAVGEDGKVFAIEPSERDFLRLVDNVNLNRLSNVNVYRLAVSDKIGKVSISIAPEERSALNTLGTEFSNKGIEKVQTEEVDSVTLDAFVEEEELSRIDVIKMDIEGSELKALNGAKDTIEQYRPALIVGINENSLNASNASVEEIEETLKKLRYKMYYLIEKPFFALKETTSLKQVKSNRIICLHESFIPPVLPQPKKEGFLEKVENFFTK